MRSWTRTAPPPDCWFYEKNQPLCVSSPICRVLCCLQLHLFQTNMPFLPAHASGFPCRRMGVCPLCSLACGGFQPSVPSSHVRLRPQRGALVVSGRHPALGHKMRQKSLGDEIRQPTEVTGRPRAFPRRWTGTQGSRRPVHVRPEWSGGVGSPGIEPSDVGPELSVLLRLIQQIRVFSITASRYIYTLPEPSAVLAEAGQGWG